MSKGKLTRQELGWLITQEAQGAAERLRRGVNSLKSSGPDSVPLPESSRSVLPESARAALLEIPPASPVGFDKMIPSFPPSGGLDATLDALDDAMTMLSSLHQKPTGRGRRGRIDLAALIWEISPEANVAIEPGSGTEVFGEENEFRRMLQVLIGQGTGAGSRATIRGDGEEVHVRVELGPEGPGVTEVERAWLSRMAIRYGGRYELDGVTEVIVLPADGVSEQKEREALRKELDEARKQGEAYARELAAVLTNDGEQTRPSTIPPAPFASVSDRHLLLTRLSGGIAAEIRNILSPAARAVQTRETPEEKWEVVRRALARAQELVVLLSTFAIAEDPPQSVEIGEAVRAAIRTHGARADRAEVTVETDLASIQVTLRTRVLHALLHELVQHAIDATPRGNKAVIKLEAGDRAKLIVDDAGSALAAHSRRALVELEIEAATLGRPSALPLFFAMESARALGAEFELADAPSCGVRVQITFPG